MPAHNPGTVFPPATHLHQMLQLSQQAVKLDNPVIRNGSKKTAETVPFRIRKMDHKLPGGKLPPVSKRWQLADEDIDLDLVPKALPQEVSQANVNIKPDPRNQPILDKRQRLRKSSSETSSTMASYVKHSRKRRLARDSNSNVGNSTSISRQYHARKELQSIRFSSLPLSLSIASDYEIPSVEGGHDGTRTNTTGNFVVPSDLAQHNQIRTEMDKSSDSVETLPKKLEPSSNDPPDVRKRRYSDLTLQRLHEMQLRYKNLMQLSKQVQFSSTQVLKGERIRKPHTLPGLKSQNLACHDSVVNKDLELLAVLSVKQASESEPATNPINHNSVTLGLAKTWSGNAHSDFEGSTEQALRRETLFENRKKLYKKDALMVRRRRREALKEDSERMLITKAIEMGNTKENKSNTLSWDTRWQNTREEHIRPSQYSPKATVTISGESPVRKSIEITLPDCNVGLYADDETDYLDRENTNAEILHATDVRKDDNFSEVVLDSGETSDLNGPVKVDPLQVSSVKKSTEELPSEPLCKVESRSLCIGDFLSVPVGNITRSIDVLSLGRSGRSSGMDIPEIRMICATPLPPGSP